MGPARSSREAANLDIQLSEQGGGDHHQLQQRKARPRKMSSNVAAGIKRGPPVGLSLEERTVLWEVNLARGCLESFSKMLGAHAIVLSLLATVNFVGFLQPPKGWDDNSGYMYSQSWAVRVFAIANSFSFFTAIAGLLVYIYCSSATVVSLAAMQMPTEFDEFDLQNLYLLHACFRRVALPSVKRRARNLFIFLAASLTLCVIAFVSSSIASTRPEHRAVIVALPTVPGCVVVLFLLYLAAAKLNLELDFNARFSSLWSEVAQIDPPTDDRILPITASIKKALDPLPKISRMASRFSIPYP